MLSFKQFIVEMPVLSRFVPKIGNRDESDLNDTLSNSFFKGAKKISKFDSHHDIHQYNVPNNTPDYIGQAYLVVHRRSKRIKARITGQKLNGEFQVGFVAKHSSAKFNMADVYHHIIQNHTPIVSDVEHSPGAQKLWKNLASRNDIDMSAYSNGKETKAFGPHEWNKNYEGNINNSHRLVARKKINAV